LADHVDALQQVYRRTPSYWQRYNFAGAPAGQAENDLKLAAETPGRTLLGIARPFRTPEMPQGTQIIGMIDLRLHWPGQTVASLGMIMVAEPFQRQGIATQAWGLLKPWLASSAAMHKVRLGVEQFNPAALKFFEHIGFVITGETARIKEGDKFVRLIYMEQQLLSDE
jgi:RimJ/RimL family protein N-acetyltransferase